MPSKNPLFFRKRQVLPLAFGKPRQHDEFVLVFLQNLVTVDLSAASCILMYLQKHSEVQQTIVQQISLKAGMFLPACMKCPLKEQTIHPSITVLNLFELFETVGGKSSRKTADYVSEKERATTLKTQMAAFRRNKVVYFGPIFCPRCEFS